MVILLSQCQPERLSIADNPRLALGAKALAWTTSKRLIFEAVSPNDFDSENFYFNPSVLSCAVGGISAIDLPQLEITSFAEASAFCQNYGFDLQNPQSLERAWLVHRRAVAFLRDHLLEPGESIPECLSDPVQLQSPAHLLVYASPKYAEAPQGSGGDELDLRKWSCALLRIMHVYFHLESDLFSYFFNDIQDQILKPVQSHIFTEPGSDTVSLGSLQSENSIRLHKFEVKPFKATSSSIVKLLAKSDAITLTLLDKLGMRFVTRSVFDAFRVIRYLFDKHLVSFPHIIPDQSINTIYPTNLFLEVMSELRDQPGSEGFSPDRIQTLLDEHLSAAGHRAQWREKPNAYTDKDYRFIKFINRKLIEVNLQQAEGSPRPFGFFYPFEIQIMDYQTYLNHLSGPSAHDQYKDRQRKAARLRVLGGR